MRSDEITKNKRNNEELKAEVDSLTSQLQTIRIERLELHVRVRELERDLQEERAHNQINKAARNNNIRGAAKTRRDRHGAIIRPGDRVTFLSPTKFNATGGTVAYFTEFRVTVIDNQGRKISKDADNLIRDEHE